ncbi:putative quinol monooxygenase [Streptomyces malaysiensis]|uniref:Antibiotic biosynthesis monooxygenase n=1 Tax=Streptomyces malaysiensis subsp. samsunensis TaxID=459658 RepID=A0A9X2M2Z7_STRMQ|nr:antibiotic biosynthesis monooxygenase [Streptomyces samsunensis]MCQ8835475.1 antibiotic biosynthesis monooxygenase [Streptomyces samsunensis]
MSEVIVLARLQAKPGHGPDLLSLLSDLAGEVMDTEPETLRYAILAEPSSEPLQITVIERYASRAAAEAHDTGVLTKYLPELLDLLDVPPSTVELQPAGLAVSVDDGRLRI